MRGRVQRPPEEVVGIRYFPAALRSFFSKMAWLTSLENGLMGISFQEDENCYKDSGKPLEAQDVENWAPRPSPPVGWETLWREGCRVLCTVPPGDGWLEMGPKSLRKPPHPHLGPHPSLFLLSPLSLLWKDSILPSQGREPLECPERHWDSETGMCRPIAVRSGLSPASLSRGFMGIFPNFLVSLITSLPAVIGEGLGWMNWRSGG